jgi:hypothetical protein
MFVLVGIAGGVLLLCLVVTVVGLIVWAAKDDEKKQNPKEVVQERPPVQDPVRPPIRTESPPPPQPPPLTVSPEVRKAIDRGVAHLKRRLWEKRAHYDVKGNPWPDQANVGATALSALALLEAQVPPHDPAIQYALGVVRENAPRLEMVYTLGSILFFLNRLHEIEPLKTSDCELVRSLALRLAAGQLHDGRWTYVNPCITAEAEQELLKKLQANDYVPVARKHDQWASHSMTQFALLALWGSRRQDIPLRPVLLRSANHFHTAQLADGTWDYNIDHTKKAVLRDSNTCAGLIALAMEKTLREDKEFKGKADNDPPANPGADEQCEKAFAHLATVIGRTRNDPVAVKHDDLGNVIRADAFGDYYFLWCLERVAVIYDKKEIGGKDWYAWGSGVIVQNQRFDGSWQDRHGDVADTCFALLFLTRANLARDLTESIRARGSN